MNVLSLSLTTEHVPFPAEGTEGEVPTASDSVEHTREPTGTQALPPLSIQDMGPPTSATSTRKDVALEVTGLLPWLS